jgi:hypothetical protein
MRKIVFAYNRRKKHEIFTEEQNMAVCNWTAWLGYDVRTDFQLACVFLSTR